MDRGETLYARVASGIRELIEAGTLRPGERIPSVRKLSQQHKVSTPTVMQAYTVLENQHLIEARPRSGYFVRHRRVGLPIKRGEPVQPQALADFPPLMSLVADITNPRLVPMGGANPSAEFLPGAKLARIIGAISREQPQTAINYDPSPGCPTLRHEISRRSLEWGCYLQADDFVITNGATEALCLALSVVTKPGDTVVVESPTYYGLINILSQLGLRALAVPADAETGLDLDETEAALRQKNVAAIVTVPNFNNPLGCLMPDTHRERLIALGAKYGVPIIEDDIYGDLQHEGRRPRSLKALDRGDGVILCGSFSKTLAPGYRAGFVAAGRYQPAIAEKKMAQNFGSAPLPLMAVAEFLRSGGYDHHVRGLRRIFRDQTVKMRQAILTEFPEGTRVSHPAGGFVLWVELAESVDALELFHQARAAQISIAPGHLFSPAAEFRNFIRISCGSPWSPAIEDAIARLGAMTRRLS